MGCLRDSEKFLNSLKNGENGNPPDIVSPTPFILSTHNTVGGQIALLLGNRSYNVTHVQDGHSFEYALIDALLMLNDGPDSLIVGGVDERIDFLNQVATELDINSDISNRISEGAGFFKLSTAKSDVEIIGARVVHDCAIDQAFLDELSSDSDLILFGESGPVQIQRPGSGNTPLVVYSDYCGLFMTNAAIGMDYAYGLLTGNTRFAGVETTVNSVTVITSYNGNSAGIITLQKT
jgi:hypothetical protein